jgi:transposase InsO family protein
MILRLHKNARTTPAIRDELRAAPASISTNALAQRYGLHHTTVDKWRQRPSSEDRSHRPRTLHATLTPEQEEIVAELRRTLLIDTVDLLMLVREFICPTMSESALKRMMKRHGVSSLRALMPQEEPEEPAKPFKRYPPGFVHVDVKYLPRMADEASRSYLYVAIDRATRWVFFEIHPDKRAETAAGFLERLVAAATFRVEKVLSDNGPEFTDRFVHGRERTPTGKHAFDRVCAKHGIEHRLIRPWRPQTNGMAERFNGRIADQLGRTHFENSAQLRSGLEAYRQIYLNHLPQRVLGHRTPRQALLDWFKKEPERFRTDPHNLPAPDI